MNPLIQLKKATPVFLVGLVLACFALSPKTQAVLPAPDGGYGPPAYGTGNTAEGQSALLSLTTGTYNTAIGWSSLKAVIHGSFNTATGAGALFANTGNENTATGAVALFTNGGGIQNTATGFGTLYHNTTGSYNTANGYLALFSNTIGAQNTATGANALAGNITGSQNSAFGWGALAGNTANFNTATGFNALHNNTGYNNTANGEGALFNNTGDANTAIGAGALFNNTTGGGNIALGWLAGDSVTTAEDVICIGYNLGGANVSNTCFIGSIRGVTTQNADAIPVLIDSNSQLGTASSSRRYKTDIKPLDNASESILALKPVSFRYKVHKDVTPQYGLIAEEVAEVNPDLVIYDVDGKPYTVRYDAVNAMLLNEFLKEHRKVEEQSCKIENQARKIHEQQTAITHLQKEMATVIAHSKEQDSQIQRVSDQVQVSSAKRRTVASKQ